MPSGEDAGQYPPWHGRNGGGAKAMSRSRRILSRFRNLFRNRRAEVELVREVESHLALIAEDFERRGMSQDDAQLAAKRAYGGGGPAEHGQRRRAVLASV